MSAREVSFLLLGFSGASVQGTAVSQYSMCVCVCGCPLGFCLGYCSFCVMGTLQRFVWSGARYSREPPPATIYLACAMYSSGAVLRQVVVWLLCYHRAAGQIHAAVQIPRPPAPVIGYCGMGSQTLAGVLAQVPFYLCGNRDTSCRVGSPNMCVWVPTWLVFGSLLVLCDSPEQTANPKPNTLSSLPLTLSFNSVSVNPRA